MKIKAMPQSFTKDQLEQIRLELIAEANSTHSQYPQYKNYWDNWQVCVVTRNIKNKWGDIIAYKDQPLLVNLDSKRTLESPSPYAGKEAITVYIPDNLNRGCNTSVRLNYLGFID